MFEHNIEQLPPINPMQWLNTAVTDTKDKIVLVDFFTYSCVNCLRSIPHIKNIWQKYMDHIIIIGVHSPEFDFEKNIENIQEAVKRLGIKYPVAVDSDFNIWNSFSNKYWPCQYLFDKDGKLVFNHAGEGGEEKLDEKIHHLLLKEGIEVKEKIDFGKKKHLLHTQTPEIYMGSLRNEGIGSKGVCSPEGCAYTDEDEHKEGVAYLDGAWDQKEEYVEHTNNELGYIALKYHAAEANAVMEGPGEVNVYLDGHYVTKEEAGNDVQFDGERSFILVEMPDMYEVIKTPERGKHELKLETKYPSVRIYAYTFG